VVIVKTVFYKYETYIQGKTGSKKWSCDNVVGVVGRLWTG